LENLPIAFVVPLRVLVSLWRVRRKPKPDDVSHAQRKQDLLPKQQYRIDTDDAKFRRFLCESEPVEQERLEIASGDAQEIFTNSVEKCVEIVF
jgi:hypothetical protein